MLSVILLSMLMILLFIVNVIRHLICGNNFNWLLNMNLIYETLGPGKKWIVGFNAEKTQLVSFDPSDNNHLLRCWCWPSLLNWIRVHTLSQLLKLPPRKLELYFALWSFFLLRLLCISINLLYVHVCILWSCLGWCTLLLLRIVRQSTKTNMQGCWSFSSCFFWTLGSSSKYGLLNSFL